MKTTDPNTRSKIIQDTLLSLRDKKFRWGEHDCLMFCANHVLAYTERDYAESFRGKYTTRRGAEAMIAKLGAKDIIEFVGIILNEKPQPVFSACVGWVMAFRDIDGEIAIGICMGPKALYLDREGQVVTKDLTECLCCWRV